MKSKLFIIIGIVLLFYMVGLTPVIAGDIPESALQFSDYCLTGSVEKIQDNITTIKIAKVLFGDFEEDTINIIDLKYSTEIGKSAEPKIGDYCAVVVKKESDLYKVYEGLAAKADSLNKKKLKLKSTNEFIIRMNAYINSGWYSNDTIDMINKKIAENNISRSAICTPDVITPTAMPTLKPTATISANVEDVSPVHTNSQGELRYYILAGAGIILLAEVVSMAVLIGKGKKEK